jgi:hypothetical protein
MPLGCTVSPGNGCETLFINVTLEPSGDKASRQIWRLLTCPSKTGKLIFFWLGQQWVYVMLRRWRQFKADLSLWFRLPALLFVFVSYLLFLLFDPEDRASIFLRNVCQSLPDYMALHFTEQYWSFRIWRVLVMVLPLRIVGLVDFAHRLEFSIRRNRIVSEIGSVSVFRSGEGDTYSVGSLAKS